MLWGHRTRLGNCENAGQLGKLMTGTDRIISQPKGGQGASLVIRYELPR